MRRDIFGLGLVQVMVSALAIIGVAWVLAGQPWTAAIVIGFGLALSSTAFGVQILKNAAISTPATGSNPSRSCFSRISRSCRSWRWFRLSHRPRATAAARSVTDIAITVGAILALLVAGRYLLNPLFQVIAGTGAKEAMIAAALFVVLASGTLMQVAGLSMALGAFIAGVMLAESSYRHELEADIEPFRGILLGLFFMAVGLSLDLSVIADNMAHHPHLACRC
jgi:CPA2 family monovalent cation:H+ antiporter-2